MSANDSKRLTAYSYDPFEDLVIIGGKAIPEGGGPHDTDDGDSHPLYDERILDPLLESDVLDVKERGIHTAIRVRKNGKHNELLFGRKRVRLARAVFKRFGIVVKVPTIHIDLKNDKDLFGYLVSENEHREEDSYARKASKALRYKRFGATDAEIALAFRFDSELSVRNLLAFYDLDAVIQTAIVKGDIAPSTGIALKDLPRAEQIQALEELQREAAAKGTRVKVEHAQQKARVKSGKAQPGTERPGLRVLGKVLGHEKAESLPDGFLMALKWVKGELPPERVKGLKQILKDLYLGE